ncbi:hypothetical protein [Marivirga harenae]|uniref:hypothetical protein n=1 Tax=Marivirga harenae TaxID=2010992 RepID=UPI0026DFD46A|nr:hypothetical protein [Marivirga harenae]WKV11251.1 hypothetical protein Q3Y49_13650 [Marivirga harenae]|tara:strand:+ start:7124 stop:7771 length:648 start_codon:yes stop_codon:yes gene_type:complete
MKIRNIVLVTIFASTAACTTGKFSSSYKAERSTVDSLTLLTPIVLVEENDGENKKNNLLIGASNSIIISEISKITLSSKYSIVGQELTYQDIDELFEVCKSLEFSENILDGQIVPKGFLNNIGIAETKYGLILIYRATFNPLYEPHYNLTTGIATSSLIIAPQSKPFSDLRLLVINLENGEVAHYSSKISENHDPRVAGDVEFLTKAILKSVYYR